jgi:integrase
MRYVKKQMPTMREIQAMPPGKPLYLGYGLVLKKSPTSTTWYYRFTSPITHKVTETSIGPWPEYGYSSARQVAVQLHVMVLKGEDPVQVARQKEGNKTTFAEAAKGWIETQRQAWRPGGLRDATLLLTKHGARLADVPVGKITPDMVDAALADLKKRYRPQAERARGMFARVFDYAKAMGYRTGDNPAAKELFEHRWGPQPKTHNNHHTALPYQELPDFMRRLRLRQTKATSALALEFLILTASRTGEVLGMKWSEINWDQKLWIVPPERMKTGNEHRVPLSDRAMQILAIQKEYRTASDYVFTGYKRVALDDKAFRVLLKSMDVPVTVHGFRSSFRDWCAVNKFDYAASEKSLAHTVGSQTARAYFRDDLLDERRKVMDAWASFIG